MEKLLDYGIAGITLFALIFIMRAWIKSNDKRDRDYQELVKKVQEESLERENKYIEREKVYIKQAEEHIVIIRNFKEYFEKFTVILNEIQVKITFIESKVSKK